MKPTLNQLINFCTVAETGNIGKAASKLNISQPPLSRQIAQLETILGAKLFNRAAKGVSCKRRLSTVWQILIFLRG